MRYHGASHRHSELWMSRLTFAACALVFLSACTDRRTDPPTSVDDPPPPPAPAISTGLHFRAGCVSVWDREIDGDWKGLVMFTDTSEVLVDTVDAGPHDITLTRWMPAPIVVFKDSVTVRDSALVTLACP
jgi:hypothetical protein